MWIYTPEGFMSVVNKGDVDEDGKVLLCVRSRYEGDLAGLKSFMSEFRNTEIEIEFTYRNDYQCRVFVRKIDFMTYMAKLIGNLDYSNFKSKCANDSVFMNRESAMTGLGRIWATTYESFAGNHVFYHGEDGEWNPEKEFL